ncbi:MAG: LicD family protein [Candidatus Saccharibacteria bacterium]|nr:LicD family protein [Candidatus Saccharibacteria bacterium]
MEKADPVTKKIQKINLKTYKVFAELCKRHNLRYFAISGTAIGVHFWNGFIPWDDDMDIAMPIKDFEKFRDSIHKELPESYGFIELPELGGKIYNKNTTLIESPYAFLPDHYYGVFLDIVPLIGLPDDPKERKIFSSKIRHYIIEATAVDRAPELKTFTGQTIQTIKKTRQYLTTAYPFGTTKYCTDFSCIKCPCYITKGFLNPKIASFEDTKIPISSYQNHDLKIAYKQLVKDVPKKERQLVHHNFYAFCDINNPCIEYKKSYSKNKAPNWLKEISYKNHLFGMSSAREANLYKIRCQELEEQIKTERQRHETEIRTIRSSNSYKIGNYIIRPLSKMKFLSKKVKLPLR